jgi:hypothetical protein
MDDGDNNKEQPMDENKFWLRIWQLLAGLAAVGILTTGGCVAYESKLVSDAMTSGKDPIAARCAISGTSTGYGQAALCTLKAAGK